MFITNYLILFIIYILSNKVCNINCTKDSTDIKHAHLIHSASQNNSIIKNITINISDLVNNNSSNEVIDKHNVTAPHSASDQMVDTNISMPVVLTVKLRNKKQNGIHQREHKHQKVVTKKIHANLSEVATLKVLKESDSKQHKYNFHKKVNKNLQHPKRHKHIKNRRKRDEDSNKGETSSDIFPKHDKNKEQSKQKSEVLNVNEIAFNKDSTNINKRNESEAEKAFPLDPDVLKSPVDMLFDNVSDKNSHAKDKEDTPAETTKDIYKWNNETDISEDVHVNKELNGKKVKPIEAKVDKPLIFSEKKEQDDYEDEKSSNGLNGKQVDKVDEPVISNGTKEPIKKVVEKSGVLNRDSKEIEQLMAAVKNKILGKSKHKTMKGKLRRGIERDKEVIQVKRHALFGRNSHDRKLKTNDTVHSLPDAMLEGMNNKQIQSAKKQYIYEPFDPRIKDILPNQQAALSNADIEEIKKIQEEDEALIQQTDGYIDLYQNETLHSNQSKFNETSNNGSNPYEQIRIQQRQDTERLIKYLKDHFDCDVKLGNLTACSHPFLHRNLTEGNHTLITNEFLYNDIHVLNINESKPVALHNCTNKNVNGSKVNGKHKKIEQQKDIKDGKKTNKTNTIKNEKNSKKNHFSNRNREKFEGTILRRVERSVTTEDKNDDDTVNINGQNIELSLANSSLLSTILKGVIQNASKEIEEEEELAAEELTHNDTSNNQDSHSEDNAPFNNQNSTLEENNTKVNNSSNSSNQSRVTNTFEDGANINMNKNNKTTERTNDEQPKSYLKVKSYSIKEDDEDDDGDEDDDDGSSENRGVETTHKQEKESAFDFWSGNHNDSQNNTNTDKSKKLKKTEKHKSEPPFLIFQKESRINKSATPQTNKATLPTNKTTLPTNKETLPTKRLTLLTHKPTLPTNKDTLPTNVSTIKNITKSTEVQLLGLNKNNNNFDTERKNDMLTKSLPGSNSIVHEKTMEFSNSTSTDINKVMDANNKIFATYNRPASNLIQTNKQVPVISNVSKANAIINKVTHDAIDEDESFLSDEKDEYDPEESSTEYNIAKNKSLTNKEPNNQTSNTKFLYKIESKRFHKKYHALVKKLREAAKTNAEELYKANEDEANAQRILFIANHKNSSILKKRFDILKANDKDHNVDDEGMVEDDGDHSKDIGGIVEDDGENANYNYDDDDDERSDDQVNENTEKQKANKKTASRKDTPVKEIDGNKKRFDIAESNDKNNNVDEGGIVEDDVDHSGDERGIVEDDGEDGNYNYDDGNIDINEKTEKQKSIKTTSSKKDTTDIDFDGSKKRFNIPKSNNEDDNVDQKGMVEDDRDHSEDEGGIVEGDGEDVNYNYDDENTDENENTEKQKSFKTTASRKDTTDIELDGSSTPDTHGTHSQEEFSNSDDLSIANENGDLQSLSTNAVNIQDGEEGNTEQGIGQAINRNGETGGLMDSSEQTEEKQIDETATENVEHPNYQNESGDSLLQTAPGNTNFEQTALEDNKMAGNGMNEDLSIAQIKKIANMRNPHLLKYAENEIQAAEKDSLLIPLPTAE